MSATSPPLESPVAANPPSTSNSPPPNSPVAATPPSTSATPPPQSFPPPPTSLNSPPPDPPSAPPPQPDSPPPQPPSAPSPQLNSPPPTTTPPRAPPPSTVISPLPMASPPPIPNAPPPQPNVPPPIPNAPPPQPNAPPPTPNAPPPQPNAPPPIPNAPPPIVNPPPPQPNTPPPQPNASPILPSSPPPSAPPPANSLPPPASVPLGSPPPPVTNPLPLPPPPRPPNNAPPPPDATPPRSSPPPVTNPSPPPPPRPPNNAPPPPDATPPRSSPPPVTNPRPPPPRPPNNAPPSPRNSPPPHQPPNNSPPPNSPEKSPPPPTEIPQSPPLPGVPPPSPATPPVPSRSSSSPPILRPPPSTVPSPLLSPPPRSLDPPRNNTTNDSSSNASEVSKSHSGGGLGTGGTVGIVVAVSFLLLGVFGIVACFVWKRKKKASGHNVGHIMPTSISSSPASESGLLKVQLSTSSNGSGLGNSWFTYDELVEATNGFSDQKLLGQGGFGSVYKGNLADGREVAIKLLKSGGGQGEREFRSEVEIIRRIHHRHLVSLVGYCISGERRLLVFDYLPNDTLYFHLHGEGQPVMDWATRVKIAIGAARGISYLHEDCHPRIIHRDIKSSNILLDSNFEARVSDFGLAKLAMDANTHISTRVMGTFGYMAPEYASSGKLTEKSDVYSFGVVLLELTTGRKPVDTSQPLGDESLVEWARPLLSDALETEEFGVLADPRLYGNFVAGEMFRLFEVAAACVRHSSAKRPTMGQVVRAFDSMATSDLTNGMKVGESEIFSSAQQSAEIRLFQRMAFGSQDFSTDFFSQNSRGTQGNAETSQRI